MDVYTYSEARQRFAHVLSRAAATGKVLIRRRDGSVFALTPEPSAASPLDVSGIETDMTTEELVTLLREERGRGQ